MCVCWVISKLGLSQVAISVVQQGSKFTVSPNGYPAVPLLFIKMPLNFLNIPVRINCTCTVTLPDSCLFFWTPQCLDDCMGQFICSPQVGRSFSVSTYTTHCAAPSGSRCHKAPPLLTRASDIGFCRRSARSAVGWLHLFRYETFGAVQSISLGCGSERHTDPCVKTWVNTE